MRRGSCSFRRFYRAINPITSNRTILRRRKEHPKRRGDLNPGASRGARRRTAAGCRACGRGAPRGPTASSRGTVGARRRRACLQAGSLLGCVRSTTARCVVSCAGSRSSMERCPRRFASAAGLHTAVGRESCRPHMDGTVTRLAVRAATRAQRFQLHVATVTAHATTPQATGHMKTL